MSFTKKFLKSKPVCKVTFSYPEGKSSQVQKVELLGSFTSWKPIAMRKVKGGFTRTLDLPVSSQQQFRYRINGEKWENDDAADAYVPNGVDHQNNSVVVL